MKGALSLLPMQQRPISPSDLTPLSVGYASRFCRKKEPEVGTAFNRPTRRTVSPPHAGQSCHACVLALLARKPGVPEKGGALYR